MLTRDEDQAYPKLKLLLIQGNLFKEKFLDIYASGLECSKRKALDGVNFFGYMKMGEVEQLIDYEIDMDIKNLSENQSSIIFMVYFKRDDAKYYIRNYSKKRLDNGKASVLIKIDKPYVSQFIGLLIM